ncbi:hypothetical protein D1AOALGA4SA_7747 [Olavius algarvensis Delta 1 endosymbiont]|nr:hypothetical protein D1AOALGA4SA_7747 [Olavius algarvensis Delta 1 endosymbiont]
MLEYWDIKERHQTFSQYSNTPVLQYSEIYKNSKPLDRLPSFGL